MLKIAIITISETCGFRIEYNTGQINCILAPLPYRAWNTPTYH